MEFKISASLQLEHEKLLAELAKAVMVHGRLGEAAKNVAKVLDTHFRKEEEYALPPLGLLSVLAGGKARSDMQEVLPMTDRLKAPLKNY
jgi:hypothetical protein